MSQNSRAGAGARKNGPPDGIARAAPACVRQARASAVSRRGWRARFHARRGANCERRGVGGGRATGTGPPSAAREEPRI
ncbi:hypothetical protein AQ611_05360 [Burkholderia singularis]|nr:hypothetical protein AQ611_05360 [Burkholderia sp. Bp7605]